MLSRGKVIKKERKQALIIGLSSYRHLPSLKFCKKDGNDIYRSLTSRIVGFRVPDRCKLIGAVPREQMRKAMTNFFDDNKIKPNDTLLFYFSGHGVIESNGDGYFGTYEIDPDRPYDMGIPFSYLSEMMERSTSKKIVTILDCCYSGSASFGSKGVEREDTVAKIGKNTITKRVKSGEGKYLLAACLGYQEAFSTRKQENSIFTHYLLEGLKGGEGESIDKDGNVSPYTLGKFIYSKIMSLPPGEKPKQKPITKVEASGDISLAHYPIKVERMMTKENETVLELLRQGNIIGFNDIRRKDPYKSLDLHRVNLEGVNLTGVKLQRANLFEANLEGAKLAGADLTEANVSAANLQRTNLRRANLRQANLDVAYLTGANLTGAYLVTVRLTGANLRGANLAEAHLWGANLTGANLERAKLTGAKLVRAKLAGADLTEANLEGANLEGASLREADLLRASLKGANLRHTYLRHANLRQTNLTGANLGGANLDGASLKGANLRHTNLRQANLSRTELERAKLERVELTGAKSLPISIEEAKSRGAIIMKKKSGGLDITRERTYRL